MISVFRKRTTAAVTASIDGGHRIASSLDRERVGRDPAQPVAAEEAQEPEAVAAK